MRGYANNSPMLGPRHSEAAGSLTLATKSAILRAAYQTTVVSDHISQAEHDTLDGIAAALPLTDAELETVMASPSCHPPPAQA